MSRSIKGLKVYIPARNFELSTRFYSELGFKMSPAFGGTVDFELGGHQIRLQDYYVKDWADNCMMVLDVDDVEAWHRHAQQTFGSGAIPGVRIKAPESVDGSLVFHLWDPSGVLLVFVQ